MASCSFVSTGRTFKLSVTETKYSVENNTSTVKWEITISGGGTQWYDSYCKATVNGSVVYNETKGWSTGTFPAKDGSVSGYIYDIPHDSQGKASISFALEGYSEVYSTKYASGSLELTTIPRASEVACSSPYIGDNAIISIDKKSSAFTNTVTYKIGTITGTIATKTSSTTLQLNTSAIADQIYALIPNDKEIQGTIYCTTYSGSTQIGDTKSTTFNLYAKESVCKPSVRATIIDNNTAVTTITGSNNKFIKYISKPTINVLAEPKKSASINNFSINLNDGQTASSSTSSGKVGAEVFYQKQFNTIGSNKVTVSATDSRGYSNSKDYTLDMIDYIKLHINTISITRPEGTSNEAILNCNGAYFNGLFTDEVSNTLTATFKYRLSGATEWTDGGSITPTIENNTFKFTNLSLGELFDYNEEYQFKIILQDKFMTVGDLDSDIITLPKGQEVVAIGEDGVWIYGTQYLNDKELWELIYPVGSVYMSTNSTSPATLFGGTWERLKGGFLYGAVNSYGTGNGTGTSTNTHKLTINETPAHEHTIRYNGSSGNGVTISRSGSGYDVLNLTEWEWTVGDVLSNLYTNSVGGNKGHSHNIPYIAVFMWRRTA